MEENTTPAPSASEQKERLNNLIAVTVAILSGFMAVTKVKDDNLVQAMLQAKSDAIDTWNEYQSKRIKHHLAELARDQSTALAAAAPQAASRLEEQARGYAAAIGKYEKEESDLRDQAKAFEKQYDILNFRDDQFDLSDACLSVALAMLAVTALTGKRWLLWVSWTMTGFGFLMGIAGLFAFHIHPDALVKLLS
jgi:hypothetical protein